MDIEELNAYLALGVKGDYVPHLPQYTCVICEVIWTRDSIFCYGGWPFCVGCTFDLMSFRRERGQ
jgi:hypothetical protein